MTFQMGLLLEKEVEHQKARKAINSFLEIGLKMWELETSSSAKFVAGLT